MSLHSDDLAAARQRIAAAYDPSLLENAGHRLAQLLGNHLARAERSEGSVLPWTEPQEAIRRAAALLEDQGQKAQEAFEPAQVTERFVALAELMLDRGLNLHDPRYIGHQVPAPVPLAGLFDAKIGRAHV